MNDPVHPQDNNTNDLPPTDKKSRAKLAWVISGWLLLILLILAILLPALGAARRSARGMKNTTQIRGIVQGLFNYATTNNERMPGLDSRGFIIPDGIGSTGDSGHGATIEARYWLMLDNNNFSGEYIISPSESKSVWTTGTVTSDNYSFALLNLHSKKDIQEDKKNQPDQAGRAGTWKAYASSQTVLIADRARSQSSLISDNYGGIYSLHTDEDDAEWAGGIGFGDGSFQFKKESTADTRYSDDPLIKNDRLFAKEQSPKRKTDVIPSTETWDTTANALLGYTSVGYEDPDIASD